MNDFSSKSNTTIKDQMVDEFTDKQESTAIQAARIMFYDISDTPTEYRKALVEIVIGLAEKNLSKYYSFDRRNDESSIENILGIQNTVQQAFEKTIDHYANATDGYIAKTPNISTYDRDRCISDYKKLGECLSYFFVGLKELLCCGTNFLSKFVGDCSALYRSSALLLKAMEEERPDMASKLQIYGCACRVVDAYMDVDKMSQFLKGDSKDLLSNAVKAECAYIENYAIEKGCRIEQHDLYKCRDQKLENLDFAAALWKDISDGANINKAIYIAAQVMLTDLLPTALRKPKMIDRIVLYFENRRVDTLKDAISLCFNEMHAEKLDAENKAETAWALSSQQAEFNAKYKRMQDENARNYNEMMKKQKELVNEQKELVNEHNKLVDKHNNLIDELKK